MYYGEEGEEGEEESTTSTELPETDYEKAVEVIKQTYPKIGRRVYITPKKTWKQIYEEMMNIIQRGEVDIPKKAKAKK
jgi:hypothetical protein